MPLELRNIAGDEMEVCLEEDGIRMCCIVSSMHLAYSKEPQLREAIKRQANNAFIEDQAHNRFVA